MILALLLVVILVLILQLLHARLNSNFWRCLKGIPGPPAIPILGNIFDLIHSPDIMFTKERERYRTFNPIYKLWSLHVAAVYLVDPKDIEQFMVNPKHITKSKFYDFLHPWLGTGLLTSTGEKWQKRRKLLTPTYHFSILQKFVHVFNDETKHLIDNVKQLNANCDSIDVLPLISQFTLQSIGETAMGSSRHLTVEVQKKYKEAVYGLGEMIAYRSQRPWLYENIVYKLMNIGNREKSFVRVLHNYSTSIIANRKKLNGESYLNRKRLAMLDLLLAYKTNGADIDDEGIREEVDTFVFEGHDTTAMAICFALMLLANNKQAQDRVVSEIRDILGDLSNTPTFSQLQSMKYLERCLKEALRLYPSVPMISRITGEDFHTPSGYTIPKDCIVNVTIYDMHRNPKFYPNPDKFDPDRFLPENVQGRNPFSYMPFSAGQRNCIGQKFALFEMKTVICGILANFILEPVDRPEDMIFVVDLVLRTKNKIRVKFVERK